MSKRNVSKVPVLKKTKALKDWALLVSKHAGFTAAVNGSRAVHDGGPGSRMQVKWEQENGGCLYR